jgi:chromosome segregation ATPase
MGMSIDVSQLEIVKTFSGFLQIMQEPDKYKDLLKETDRLIAEQKKLLGPIQTKEQADTYLANAKTKIDNWIRDDEKAKTEFTAYQVAKKAEIQAEMDSAQKVSKEAKEKLAEANALIKTAQASNLEADKKLSDAKTKEASVVAMSDELTRKNQALDERIAQVQKMLGV